jgi:N utilization substance protein B
MTSDPRKKTPDKKANRRGAARLAAVQALYQMDIAGAGINDIFAEFESHWLGGEVEGEKYLPAEAAFFRDVVSGVVRDQAKLDPLIDDALSKGWPLKRIDAILRAVLRAGSYELEHRKDVPARVVVSEYVDVAHAFVDGDETGMVNAVLDQIARQFRGDEFLHVGRGAWRHTPPSSRGAAQRRLEGWPQAPCPLRILRDASPRGRAPQDEDGECVDSSGRWTVTNALR